MREDITKLKKKKNQIESYNNGVNIHSNYSNNGNVQ